MPSTARQRVPDIDIFADIDISAECLRPMPPPFDADDITPAQRRRHFSCYSSPEPVPSAEPERPAPFFRRPSSIFALQRVLVFPDEFEDTRYSAMRLSILMSIFAPIHFAR